MAKRYWLFKSEPDVFSFSDLKQSPDQTTSWEGVRNYQARNLLRDEIKVGDEVLFYHSRQDPMHVAGVCRVVREAYPDRDQFDPKSKYYDPKSKKESPTWVMVDVQYVHEFKRPVTLKELKETPGLEEMMLLRRGARLSIQPVSPAEWKIVTKMGNSKAPASPSSKGKAAKSETPKTKTTKAKNEGKARR